MKLQRYDMHQTRLNIGTEFSQVLCNGFYQKAGLQVTKYINNKHQNLSQFLRQTSVAILFYNIAISLIFQMTKAQITIRKGKKRKDR